MHYLHEQIENLLRVQPLTEKELFTSLWPEVPVEDGNSTPWVLWPYHKLRDDLLEAINTSTGIIILHEASKSWSESIGLKGPYIPIFAHKDYRADGYEGPAKQEQQEQEPLITPVVSVEEGDAVFCMYNASVVFLTDTGFDIYDSEGTLRAVPDLHKYEIPVADLLERARIQIARTQRRKQ